MFSCLVAVRGFYLHEGSSRVGWGFPDPHKKTLCQASTEVKVTARLDNQIAVVTGGSRGIGAAIARKFAEEGARVVIAESNSA